MSNIFLEELPAPPVDRKEILRYLKGGDESGELVEACLNEVLPVLSYRVCYGEFPIEFKENSIDLGFAETGSKALRKNLAGCREIVIFAATVGVGMDRLIARYGAVSPVKSLCMDAIGAERIEALCDAFQSRYPGSRPRFSPGYGDLPLELQTELFRTLNPARIGLTLNASLLMSPSKSVTAIFGK